MPDSYTDSLAMTASVSKARLLSVLDTAVDGIVIMDESARIILYNKACEALFGYQSEEVRGKNVKILMPESYAREHDGYVRSYIDTGVRRIIGIGREVKARHRDGTEFPIELSVGEAQTPEGRQFIGIMRDIRQRKLVEERLSKAQAQLVSMARINALDEMGAAIAHELNQPLTAIMLYLQAIKRKSEGVVGLEGVLIDVIDKGVKEAERASQIIQRMRQFVEKREPERKPVDVPTLLRECVDLVTLGKMGEGVLLSLEVGEDMPELNADPVQIQQIVVNLIRNAMDAVKGCQKKAVDIRAWHDEEAISIAVSDSGPGVPQENLANLFKAFSGSKRSGLGLGLAISKSLAQNHGGDLAVDPVGPSGGATFTLKLPIDEPSAAGE
ncbi:PAS domain S-box protein [Stappia sp. F7233]|uniref:Sensor protein FixL n=1 Tax=Stappia albiluteola TaxID=2758565 RepID=A0A839AJJ4_9HYPH|nr:PAS domain S-box protein [Stappia albiluteola]MBA5779134.1 PAS domain S-box protein [Stappia albiluteola]